MCGLTLAITPVTDLAEDIRLIRSLHAANSFRGPNAHGLYARRISTPGGDVLLTLASSVLGLRGAGVTAQPLVGKRGVLGWNGQVFSGLEVAVHENDTVKIFERLESGEDPETVFANIEGPWAFVYFCFATTTLTFGTDPLSRRSLLLHIPTGDSPCQSFILSSTRSAFAREQGLNLRALDGGQLGKMDCGSMGTNNAAAFDWEPILQLKKIRSGVASVNKQAPLDNDLAGDPLQAVVAECPWFIRELTNSVRRRVDNIPAPAASTARVALLFSGGVDCSVLACLIHRCLPPEEVIELINVAFEQPHRQALPSDAGNNARYDVPDRVSGREALAELRFACPGREFRFIEINITRKESTLHRQAVIDTMYPSMTEMDLLAGYTRHRKAFERRSWPGLCEEIQLDLDRLPHRNLSRDDRMLSSHARDARYPFLDLAFVAYLSNLPVWNKCNLALPPGTGDKALIRQAALHCGLANTSRRIKRAMQFGTKSAKLYDGSTKGFRAVEKIIDT